LYKTHNLAGVIKIRRLEGLRHMIRVAQTRVDNNIFESKPEGRRVGGPRLRGLEDVENDLRKLKVKRRQKENNREEWASVVKEAKVLGGPYSQGVSNSQHL
jgi:hypothetical protein